MKHEKNCPKQYHEIKNRFKVESRKWKSRFPQIILNSWKGFTLIELLVVFSVIAILSAGSFAAFSKYSDAQTLNNAAEDVFTTLQTVKSRSLSQVKPSSSPCNNPTKLLQGYEFYASISTGYYYTAAVCKSSGDVPGSLADIVQTSVGKLPSNVSFTYPAADAELVIDTLTGNTTLVSPSSNWHLEITRNGQHKTIYVTSSGEISIN